MVIEVEHPTHGRVKQFGIALKMSETPGTVRSAAPASGEHTDEVLKDLGASASEIARLRREGVI
jgi:crotonobetainyl-CoA:carnitine CoA-transferase CaiB-like acyl-CoA transferase